MAFFHLFSGKEREDVTHGEFCALPVYFSAPPPPFLSRRPSVPLHAASAQSFAALAPK